MKQEQVGQCLHCSGSRASCKLTAHCCSTVTTSCCSPPSKTKQSYRDLSQVTSAQPRKKLSEQHPNLSKPTHLLVNSKRSSSDKVAKSADHSHTTALGKTGKKKSRLPGTTNYLHSDTTTSKPTVNLKPAISSQSTDQLEPIVGMTIKTANQAIKLEPISTQITPVNSDDDEEEELLETATSHIHSPVSRDIDCRHHVSNQRFDIKEGPNEGIKREIQDQRDATETFTKSPRSLESQAQHPSFHRPPRCEKVTEAQLDKLSSLIKIIRSGNYNEFSEMLEERALKNLLNVFVEGQTALHYSLIYGRSLAWCKLLVLEGANPNLTNRAGWHPIHLAAFNGSLETMRYLIDCIAN